MNQLTDKQDKECRRYLLKYSDQFKIKKNADGCYNIVCSKENKVLLFSFDSKLLAYHFQSGITARAKNYLIEKLKRAEVWHEVSQEGYTELIVLFKEADLLRVVPILKMRKRRKDFIRFKQKPAEAINCFPY